jgi:hypothetical protein
VQNFLIQWGAISFSRKILIHVVSWLSIMWTGLDRKCDKVTKTAIVDWRHAICKVKRYYAGMSLCEEQRDAEYTVHRQKIIPAGKEIDAYTRKVVANDNVQRPIVSALAKCIRSLHAARNAPSFQPVCTTRTVFRSYVLLSGSPPTTPLYPAVPALHRTRLSPHGDHLVLCELYFRTMDTSGRKGNLKKARYKVL